MSNSTHGILAAKIGLNLPLSVLKSGRGFYIGTFNNDIENEFFGPVSRESEEYYKTKQLAENALLNHSWTQRLEP